MNAVQVFVQHDWGQLQLTGRDRLDFLQRMSTNDMRLASGEGRATVLTTAIGRMVDRIVVYADAEDAWAVLSPGAMAVVRPWLGRHIFFMDQVKLVERTAESGLVRLVGAGAADAVRACVPDATFPMTLHHWTPLAYGGVVLKLARADALGAETWAVLGARAAVDALCAALVAGGAVVGDDAQYDALRIAACQPRYGHEISETYIPLEANLWADVSFTKGCYIGQEIIARMESRGKQARDLVLLVAEGPVAVTAPVYDGEAEIGRVTSVAQVMALGFVRPAYAEAGRRVTVGQGEAAVVAVIQGHGEETA